MNALLSWLAAVPESHSLGVVLLAAKLTLLLTVAWLLHAVLDRSNPRWRVLLWRSASAGAVILLLMTLSSPFLDWPVLPASRSDELADGLAADSKLPQAVAPPAQLGSELQSAAQAVQPRFKGDQAPTAPSVSGDRHERSSAETNLTQRRRGSRLCKGSS